MKVKSRVRICPFCGHHGHELLHDAVNVRDEDGAIEVRDVWQMKCRCCGATGPIESEPEYAIASWNAVHSEPAHDDDSIYDVFIYDDLTNNETKAKET